jgi:hypothetical protein
MVTYWKIRAATEKIRARANAVFVGVGLLGESRNTIYGSLSILRGVHTWLLWQYSSGYQLEDLKAWRELAPYPDDDAWVFASDRKKGRKP